MRRIDPAETVNGGSRDPDLGRRMVLRPRGGTNHPSRCCPDSGLYKWFQENGYGLETEMITGVIIGWIRKSYIGKQSGSETRKSDGKGLVLK